MPFRYNAVTDALDLVSDLTSIDHGSLLGLLDDDHTQYVLLAGRTSEQFVTDIFGVKGTFGSGETLAITGAGSRMFFYPRKGAFVAGTAASDQFDNANIGDYAILMGYGVRGTGNSSITIGNFLSNYATAVAVGGGSVGVHETGGVLIGNGNINGQGFDVSVGASNVIGAASSYSAVVGAFNDMQAASAVMVANTSIIESTCLFALTMGIYTLQRNATLGNAIFGIGDISVTGNPMVNAYDLTIAFGIDTEVPTMWITDGMVGGGYVGIGQTDPTTITEKLQVAGSVKATGYKSSDGSAGISGTMTTASLVGKTLTFKDGLITGFA